MDYIIDEKKLKEWYRHYGPLASTMTFDQQVDMFLMDYPTVEVTAEGSIQYKPSKERCIRIYDEENSKSVSWEIEKRINELIGKQVKILLEVKK